MNGLAEALEFIVLDDFKYANIQLKDLTLSKNTLIAGITRESKNIIPGGDDVILPNDRVIVITSGARINDLSEIIRKK
jgi:trk system potassium uptake protein TrkA